MSRFERACLAYSATVERMYRAAVRRKGYGYDAITDAPTTYEGISRARLWSERTGWPFPVWDGGSDRTVFATPEHNYMFRYLHDHDHACNGYTLSVSHERILGHLWAWKVGMESGDSDVYRIALLDTVGQTEYYAQHGEFPADQRAFVKDRFNATCHL